MHAHAHGAERLEFVQMGPSSMGAKPGDAVGVEDGSRGHVHEGRAATVIGEINYLRNWED